jgi:circadian clock protein KaiC
MTILARSQETRATAVARTGVLGLDDILSGGLTQDRMFLIEGVPGSGKTTVALQFLREGVREGEPVLYVTLSETAEELGSVATSHGWTLDGITVRELVPTEKDLRADDQYTMFHPSEVELHETTKVLLEDVERIGARRVVIDSLSEMRLLAGTALRFRRQILALKQFFAGRRCTVLLLDHFGSAHNDLHVESIVHGVVRLEMTYPEYGSERRRLLVVKYRGVRFRGGFHDYIIRTGGVEVFPRLVASETRAAVTLERLSIGVPELDSLLGGGLERGTSTLIVGAAGTGKSTLAAQFVTASAEAGLSAAMFVFDENVNTLLSRTDSLGIGLRRQVEDGRVLVRPVDPAELAPGEFIHSIRRVVEESGVAVVVIDSLNGYLNAMPGERFLIVQLHELLTYLAQAGVATVLIGAHQGLIGPQLIATVDASYLADAVVLMRYYELHGEVRQAISVVKKRGSQHERSVRDFRLENRRIVVGPPMRQFRGVLTGLPSLVGGPSAEPTAS